MKDIKIGLVAVASPVESGGERGDDLLARAEKAIKAAGMDVVVYPDLIWDAAAAIDACNKLKAEKINSLVIMDITWVIDSMKYIFTTQLQVPTMYWAVPYTETFSIGCIQHYGSILKAMGYTYDYVYGLPEDQEVIDGIRNHKSAGMPATLEGQIVRLSDKIAYVNHDIDDAVRAGIMNEEELPKELRKVLGNSKRERLNTLTHDVIVNSMDKPKICMSEEVREALMELRAYMFTHVYENPLAKGEEDKAIRMIEDLYSYYETHLEKMPEQYLKQLQKGEMPEIAVCDYIAGMTDNFAVKKFEEIFIPQSWKF